MRISDWSSDVCSSDLRLAASWWGASWPSTLLATAAVGLWLLAAPAVLGTSGAAADSDHLVGALIVTITAVALAEPTRALRYLNVGVGAWLLAAPWMVGGMTRRARLRNLVAGAAAILFSLPMGRIHDRYADRKSTRLNSSHSCASR